MQWYCFEVWQSGQWAYVGKAETTLANIRREWPGVTIEGNTVRFLSRP